MKTFTATHNKVTMTKKSWNSYKFASFRYQTANDQIGSRLSEIEHCKKIISDYSNSDFVSECFEEQKALFGVRFAKKIVSGTKEYIKTYENKIEKLMKEIEEIKKTGKTILLGVTFHSSEESANNFRDLIYEYQTYSILVPCTAK